MKPAARRRVEREIREIMRQNGDHCSICGAPLEHNTRTFGGTVKDGTTVLTGDCCRKRIATIVLEGLFLDRQLDDLVDRLPLSNTGDASHKSVDVNRAVHAIQKVFDDRQADGRAVARRAGLAEGRAKLFTQTTAWKTDDAAWFEAHPDRSHRLRSLLGDEASASGFSALGAMPDRHEMQILVRQVEPGKRMRLPFGRNLDVPIPDDEPVLHALFDIVGRQGGDGSVISMDMMRDAMARYGGATGRPS
jgi:hypothetical protein